MLSQSSQMSFSSNSTVGFVMDMVLSADPGLGGPPSLETCIILGLGVLIGSIVMGITGFGTAILHLSTWAIAGALGFNAGPLKLAVITCGFGMTVSMIPMFFLASATTQAIKPLAISIPLGKAIAAPLGALVLKFLPARQLEAMVSVLMVVIISIINRHTLRHWFAAAVKWLEPSKTAYSGYIRPEGNTRGWSKTGSLPQSHVLSASSDSSLSRLYQEADELRRPLLYTLNSGNAPPQTPTPASEVRVELPPSGADGACCCTGKTSSCTGDQADTQHSIQQEPQESDAVMLIRAGEDSTTAGASPLPLTPSVNDDTEREATYASSSSDSSSSSNSSSDESVVFGEDPVLKHCFWHLFAIGAVTGLSAGFLTGATGIGGPPMMVMYAYLQVSKAAVRGTNSVMSLVQDQVIGYFIFGLIRWDDRFAYIAGASAGLVGCLVGHSVQKLMDQKQFSRVMTGLLTLCFCLMTASAAGWINVS